MGSFSSTIFDFEWNDEKAAINFRKHGVGFEEAVTIFDDSLMVTEADAFHSDEEDRYVSIGLSVQGRILVVVYTERIRIIRIISARQPTSREKYSYENDSP